MSELHGLDDALKVLKTLPEKINGKIGRAALKPGADLVAQAAKQNVASMDVIDTTQLLKSIEVWKSKTSYSRGEVRIEINSNWYGIFAEKGFYHKWSGVHHPARPFLSSALKSSEEQIIGYVGRVIVDEIGKLRAKGLA